MRARRHNRRKARIYLRGDIIMKRILNAFIAAALLIAAMLICSARDISVPAGAFGAGHRAQTVFGMVREMAEG